MTPYYDHSGIQIYHGDARSILPSLEAGSVDLVLTDPPYGIAYETSRRSRTDPLRVPISNDKDMTVFEAIIPGLNRVLADERHWYVFGSPRMIDVQRPLCDMLGSGTKHILAWDKGDRGTVGDLACGFGEAWEAIFYGITGRRPLNGKRPRTVIRYDWSATMDPAHPTVKPVPLLAQLIRWSTDIRELVFDPFMGSGTTLIAAKQLGRKAIGIEIEEAYCEIAARRLDATPYPLFTEPEPVAEQGSLDFGEVARHAK